MRNPKRWFTIIPDGPDEDGEEKWRRYQRWFNRYYEHSGTRIRFIAGDVMAAMEREGGGRAAVEFSLTLTLCEEDVPEFYLPGNESAVYDIHSFTAVVWRWGIYLAIRGKATSR